MIGSETTQSVSENDEASTLRRQITVQCNLIRALKAVQAKDEALNGAIGKLLEMRKKFKELTGFDYVPGVRLPPKHETIKDKDVDMKMLYEELEDQECVVRSLQSAEPKGETLKEATARLFRLKEEFKERTGCEYKPSCCDETEVNEALTVEEHIAKQIYEQGNLVRTLKAKDAKSVSEALFWFFFLISVCKSVFFLRKCLYLLFLFFLFDLSFTYARKIF